MNSEEGIGKKFRRLCLRNPPASAVPRHPPLARGALVRASFPPGNDTGRVREVTNRRKLPCEIATGGTPACEIASGGTPAWEIGCGHWPPKLPPGAPRRALAAGGTPQFPTVGSYGRVRFLKACAWDGEKIGKKEGKSRFLGFSLLSLTFWGFCFAILSRWAQSPQRRACTKGR